MRMMNPINKLLRLTGYKISTLTPKFITPEFLEVWEIVKPFTMTSIYRAFALWMACKSIIQCDIEGDFVECGVWKGGSAMIMALAAKDSGLLIPIHLYDTFEGMPAPGRYDIRHDGLTAKDRWREGWAKCGVDETMNNLSLVGYDSFSLHKGLVEETIPANAPNKISILRLDTDFYESTRHEIKHLYPRLVSGGVLIIDDFNHWTGSRKAALELLPNKLFIPIDSDGVIHIKI